MTLFPWFKTEFRYPSKVFEGTRLSPSSQNFPPLSASHTWSDSVDKKHPLETRISQGAIIYYQGLRNGAVVAVSVLFIPTITTLSIN